MLDTSVNINCTDKLLALDLLLGLNRNNFLKAALENRLIYRIGPDKTAKKHVESMCSWESWRLTVVNPTNRCRTH